MHLFPVLKEKMVLKMVTAQSQFIDKLLLLLAAIKQTAGKWKQGGNSSVKSPEKILMEWTETLILQHTPVGVRMHRKPWKGVSLGV